MINGRGDDAEGPEAAARPPSAGVLADRIAAALVHHEPGWRLPRLTALARRYRVTVAEIDAAIDDLAARHLVRRLPDGQVYRASPAEYRLPLEGLTGLASHVDPMGGRLACRSRQVVRRRPPEDIGRSLRLEPGELAVTVRCLWTVGGEPGALSASYLPERLAGYLPERLADGGHDAAAALFGLFPAGPPGAGPAEPAPFGDALAGDALAGDALAGNALAGNALAGNAPGGPPPSGPPPSGPPPSGGPAAADGREREGDPAEGEPFPRAPGAGTAGVGLPRALQIEMALPRPSVARSLRLSAGELVATVTVSFEDPATCSPAALTVVMLRPDLFRIVVQANALPARAPAGAAAGGAGGFPTA